MGLMHFSLYSVTWQQHRIEQPAIQTVTNVTWQQQRIEQPAIKTATNVTWQQQRIKQPAMQTFTNTFVWHLKGSLNTHKSTCWGDCNVDMFLVLINKDTEIVMSHSTHNRDCNHGKHFN